MALCMVCPWLEVFLIFCWFWISPPAHETHNIVQFTPLSETPFFPGFVRTVVYTLFRQKRGLTFANVYAWTPGAAPLWAYSVGHDLTWLNIVVMLSVTWNAYLSFSQIKSVSKLQISMAKHRNVWTCRCRMEGPSLVCYRLMMLMVQEMWIWFEMVESLLARKWYCSRACRPGMCTRCVLSRVELRFASSCGSCKASTGRPTWKQYTNQINVCDSRVIEILQQAGLQQNCFRCICPRDSWLQVQAWSCSKCMGLIESGVKLRMISYFLSSKCEGSGS